MECLYEVVFTKQAANFIKTFDKGYRDKISAILEQLKSNPFSYPYKKIRGEISWSLCGGCCRGWLVKWHVVVMNMFVWWGKHRCNFRIMLRMG